MDIKIAQQETITELVLENQKLKQERDEAIIKYTGEANEFERQRNHAIAECEEARRERDEARKSLDEMSKYLAQATAQRDHAETEMRKWMAFVKEGAK